MAGLSHPNIVGIYDIGQYFSNYYDEKLSRRYEALIATEKLDYNEHIGLANALMGQGQYQEALEELNNAKLIQYTPQVEAMIRQCQAGMKRQE